MAARRDDYLDEDVRDDDYPALPALAPFLPASPSESSTSSQPAAAPAPPIQRSQDSQPEAAWDICQKMHTNKMGFNIIDNEKNHSIMHGGNDIAKYVNMSST
jgi:hypothetical protein